MLWICYCIQDTKFSFLRKGDVWTILTRPLDLRADVSDIRLVEFLKALRKVVALIHIPEGTNGLASRPYVA